MIPPAAVPPGATPPAAEAEADQDTALPPPSSAAQQVYSAAQADLLQIRMLLKSGRSQSTVGSGFLVGTSNLVLTNYHVVSQMALDPDVYIGEYVDTDGKSGPIELLAVDVLHDLAVVRVNRFGTGFFNMPDKTGQADPGPVPVLARQSARPRASRFRKARTTASSRAASTTS